ncbi:MAG: PRC-barrel domain-containing protein [Dichotomicrobium sp.]
MRRTATILFAGLLIATPAVAQDTTEAADNATPSSFEFVPKQLENQDLASQFIGTPVINTAGETLGKVNDMALNASGQVEVIVIGVGGFLGIAEKNVAVPYSALTREAVEDGRTRLLLDATQGDLTDAPEFLTADNQSLSVTKRMQERASEMTEKAKETYDKAKDKVMEEARELNQ